MGACFSSNIGDRSHTPPTPPPTAKIISFNGHLHQYSLPALVSHVVQVESKLDYPTLPGDTCFLSSSDILDYGEFIPALDLDHQLEASQIYFSLPTSKLMRPLTATDMAALAIKASLALQTLSSPDKDTPTRDRRILRKKSGHRISPILIVDDSNIYKDDTNIKIIPASALGFSRRGSVNKLQWSNSARIRTRTRTRTSVPSTRRMLSTIYEGAAP